MIGASAAHATTITGWNLNNVLEAPPTVLPDDNDITGQSEVDDRDSSDPDAVTNGRIAFTPPEAISPSIYVTPETYTQGGPSGITLDGCIMTSNPDTTCTGEFQSGKRIKQQMTGFGPVDLVFDMDPDTAESDSIYQVFHRLINVTAQSLAGFTIDLGFGVGNDFIKDVAEDGISFSTGFRAAGTRGDPSPVSTQFPFGLFGDAALNENLYLDGLFAPERARFDVTFGELALVSAGLSGPYADLFGSWLS